MAEAEIAAPDRQAASFRNQDQAWPSRVICRGEAVRPLPPHGRPLTDLTFALDDDVRVSLDDFMARRRTAGLLVLKDGQIALERYGIGHGPDSRWVSFSTAKSVTATLVGAALHDGAIGSLDDRCDLYLPQLLGSAYEGVTIRNVLRMCSGVAWGEENVPEDRSDVPRLNAALRPCQPGAVLDLACALPRAHPQGAVFNYSTVESCLLGAVVVAATGRPMADYCAEKIWGPAGMEADGYWLLESADGLEMGGFGVNARLRDVGRFGQWVLEAGAGGPQILPPGWRDLAGQPDSAATAFGRLMPGSPAGYGYHWWALPGAPFRDGIHAGAFLALGAFGQRVYVNPAEQVVVVVQSAWRQSHDLDAEAETVALLRAIVVALRPDRGR